MSELCKAQHKCECTPDHRGTTCEFELKTGKTYKEQRKFGEVTLNELVPCGAPAKLVDDCNSLFEHKAVLCEKHRAERVGWYDQKCRICTSPHRSCCC